MPRQWGDVDVHVGAGLLSAAVPVRTPDGAVLAALAYSTTIGRRTAEQVVDKVVPLMQDAATAISADLRLLGGTRRLDTQARDGFY